MCDRISLFDASQLGAASNSASPRKQGQRATGVGQPSGPTSARPCPRHRFISIQLKQPIKGDNETTQSQIFLVQHNWDNIDRLSNFINYHRLGICTKIEQYDPLEVSCVSLEERLPAQNNEKPLSFQLIKFDPDVIDLDNEAALGKPRPRVKIYSDIFLTQKKSYFSLRSQMINCHCHLLVPSEKAMIVLKRCM